MRRRRTMIFVVWACVSMLVPGFVLLSGCGTKKEEVRDRVEADRAEIQQQITRSVAADPYYADPFPPGKADAPLPRWPFPPILFDASQHNIRTDQTPTLKGMAEVLRADPGLLIRLTGMADERGPVELNHRLGYQRAQAVRDYLVREDVDPDQFVLVSGGEFPGRSQDEMAANRRTEGAILP